MTEFWVKKGNRSWLRLTAGLVAISFLFSTLSAPFAQASFWEERRRSVEELKKERQPLELVSAIGISSLQVPSILGNRDSALFARTNRALSLFSHKKNIPTGLPLELVEKIEQYGEIERVHLVPNFNPNLPLIIQIQDAHGVYGVQKNIAYLLKDLMSVGVGVVGVEGSEGILEGVERWRKYPDRESLMGVAGYLLKEGLLTGVEVAALGREKKEVEFYGVEEGSKYLEQVKSFKDALKVSKEVEEWYGDLGKKIEGSKKTVYTPAMLELDKKKVQYEKGDLKLGDWIEYLENLGQVPKVPVPNSLPKFHALAIYSQAYQLEKELDFKQVESEQKKILARLSDKLSRKEMTELLEESLLYRLGRIGYGEFYGSLRGKCGKYSIELTPNVKKYIEYVIKVEGIEKENLFKELKLLEEATWVKLTNGNKEAKDLYQFNKDYLLIGKAIDFKLTAEEWKEFYNLARHSGESRNPEKKYHWLDSGFRRNDEPIEVEKVLSNVSRFNQLSHERSDIFVNKLTQRMGKNIKLGVLIAGGYHSEGVEERLKKEKISYITIRPRMDLAEIKEGYHPLNSFKRDLLPLEKMFMPEKVTLAYPPILGSARKYNIGIESLRAAEGVRKALMGALAKFNRREIRDGALFVRANRAPSLISTIEVLISENEKELKAQAKEGSIINQIDYLGYSEKIPPWFAILKIHPNLLQVASRPAVNLMASLVSVLIAYPAQSHPFYFSQSNDQSINYLLLSGLALGGGMVLAGLSGLVWIWFHVGKGIISEPINVEELKVEEKKKEEGDIKKEWEVKVKRVIREPIIAKLYSDALTLNAKILEYFEQDLGVERFKTLVSSLDEQGLGRIARRLQRHGIPYQKLLKILEERAFLEELKTLQNILLSTVGLEKVNVPSPSLLEKEPEAVEIEYVQAAQLFNRMMFHPKLLWEYAHQKISDANVKAGIKQTLEESNMKSREYFNSFLETAILEALLKNNSKRLVIYQFPLELPQLLFKENQPLFRWQLEALHDVVKHPRGISGPALAIEFSGVESLAQLELAYDLLGKSGLRPGKGTGKNIQISLRFNNLENLSAIQEIIKQAQFYIIDSPRLKPQSMVQQVKQLAIQNGIKEIIEGESASRAPPSSSLIKDITDLLLPALLVFLALSFPVLAIEPHQTFSFWSLWFFPILSAGLLLGISLKIDSIRKIIIRILLVPAGLLPVISTGDAGELVESNKSSTIILTKSQMATYIFGYELGYPLRTNLEMTTKDKMETVLTIQESPLAEHEKVEFEKRFSHFREFSKAHDRAMELISIYTKTMTKRVAEEILNLCEIMDKKCNQLSPVGFGGGLSSVKESILQDKHWSTLALEDEIPHNLRKKMTQFEASNSIRKIKSVNEWINSAHQFILFRLSVLGRDFDEKKIINTVITQENSKLEILNVSKSPLIQRGRLKNRVLKCVLQGFERSGVGKNPFIVLKDNNLWYYNKLGKHSHIADLYVHLASPSKGGIISFRYSEGESEIGYQLRLEFVASVLRGLGFSVKFEGLQHLTAVLDKNNGCKSLQEIEKAIPILLRCISYTSYLNMDLEGIYAVKRENLEYEPAYDEAVKITQDIANIFLAEGMLPFNTLKGQYPSMLDPQLYDLYHIYKQNKERETLRSAIYKFLQELGLPKIPKNSVFGQEVIDLYYTEAIRKALARGELILDENEVPVRNLNYEPVKNLVKELMQSKAAAMECASALNTLDPSLILFESIGSVGQLIAVRSQLELESGTWLTLLGLSHPQTGRTHYLIPLYPNALGELVPMGADDFVSVMQNEGIEIFPGDPPSIVETMLSEELLWSQYKSPNGHMGIGVSGFPSSKGSGKISIGRVTFRPHFHKDHKVTEKNRIFAAPYTTPDDLEAIQSMIAVVTTGGGLLNHTGIMIRELGIPSVLLPSAIWEIENLGEVTRRVLRIQNLIPGPFYRNPNSYWMSGEVQTQPINLYEGDVLIVDGERGLLSLLPHKTQRLIRPLQDLIDQLLDGKQSLQEVREWFHKTKNSKLIDWAAEFLLFRILNDTLIGDDLRKSLTEIFLELENDSEIGLRIQERLNGFRKRTLTSFIEQTNERVRQAAQFIKEAASSRRIQNIQFGLLNGLAELKELDRKLLANHPLLPDIDKLVHELGDLASIKAQYLSAQLEIEIDSLADNIRELGVNDLPKIRRLLQKVKADGFLELLYPPIKKIVFVCSVNTSQSPVVDLFKMVLAQAGDAKIKVILRELDAEKSPLLIEDIEEADLILGITGEQVNTIRESYPQAIEKTFRLEDYRRSESGDITDPAQELIPALANIVASLVKSAPLYFLVKKEASLSREKVAKFDQGVPRSVISLSEIDDDYFHLVGRKASKLGEGAGEVRRLGGKVPQGFAVNTDAFQKFLEENGIQKEFQKVTRDLLDSLNGEIKPEKRIKAAQKLSIEIKELILSGKLEEGTGAGKEILEMLSLLGMEENPLAVRSSAVYEDTEGTALAGAAETYLYVPKAEVLEKVKEVWVSFWSPRAILYRLVQGMSPEDVNPAVLIQEMVNSDVSGILFTVDPLTGNEVIVINAAFGLGEGVMTGYIPLDEYRASKEDGSEIEIPRVSDKRIKVVQNKTGSGTEQADVPTHLRGSRALSPRQVEQLSNMGRELENYFGYPLDIEFAIEKGQIYIVQARPVTIGSKKRLSGMVESPISNESAIDAGRGALSSPAIEARVIEDCVEIILEKFNHWWSEYSRLASERVEVFKHKKWEKKGGYWKERILRGEEERATLYDVAWNLSQIAIEKLLTKNPEYQPYLTNREFWDGKIEKEFLRQISGFYSAEIAHTFYRTVSRKMFPDLTYDMDSFKPDPLFGGEQATYDSILRVYKKEDNLKTLLQEMILDFSLMSDDFENLERDMDLVSAYIESYLQEQGGHNMIHRVKIFPDLFVRGKSSYIFGKIIVGSSTLPLAIRLSHGSRGMTISRVFMKTVEVNHILSFTKSAFYFDIHHYREAISFLRSLVPKKRIALIYYSLGFWDTAKTKWLEEVAQRITQAKVRGEQFKAPMGVPGGAMFVFQLEKFNVVFKVIRDIFAEHKLPTSRGKIMKSYDLVHSTQRGGRLIDTIPYKNLRFPIEMFPPELLVEIKEKFNETVTMGKDYITFSHLYFQRKIIPLTYFVIHYPADLVLKVLLDLGFFIKELVYSNINLGDYTPWNIGVLVVDNEVISVVTYDFDEITKVTDIINIRDLTEEETMWGKPSSVGFFAPEELEHIMLPKHEKVTPDMIRQFKLAHGEIFTAQWWKSMQAKLRANEGRPLYFAPHNELDFLKFKKEYTRQKKKSIKPLGNGNNLTGLLLLIFGILGFYPSALAQEVGAPRAPPAPVAATASLSMPIYIPTPSINVTNIEGTSNISDHIKSATIPIVDKEDKEEPYQPNFPQSKELYPFPLSNVDAVIEQFDQEIWQVEKPIISILPFLLPFVSILFASSAWAGEMGGGVSLGGGASEVLWAFSFYVLPTTMLLLLIGLRKTFPLNLSFYFPPGKMHAESIQKKTPKNILSSIHLTLTRLQAIFNRKFGQSLQANFSGGGLKEIWAEHSLLSSRDILRLIYRIEKAKKEGRLITEKFEKIVSGESVSYELVYYDPFSKEDGIAQVLAENDIQGAYQLYMGDGKGIVFIPSNAFPYKEMALQHEEFEIARYKKLSVDLLYKGWLPMGTIPNSYWKGIIQRFKLIEFLGIQRAAHLLAWSDQIILNDWKTIDDCDFLKDQISQMDIKKLSDLLKDKRRFHLRLRKHYFDKEQIDAINQFEKSVQNFANLRWSKLMDGTIPIAERVLVNSGQVLREGSNTREIPNSMGQDLGQLSLFQGQWLSGIAIGVGLAYQYLFSGAPETGPPNSVIEGVQTVALYTSSGVLFSRNIFQKFSERIKPFIWKLLFDGLRKELESAWLNHRKIPEDRNSQIEFSERVEPFIQDWLRQRQWLIQILLPPTLDHPEEDEEYHRNPLLKSDHVAIFAHVWKKGGATRIHNHDGKMAFTIPLGKDVFEESYEFTQDPGKDEQEGKVLELTRLGEKKLIPFTIYPITKGKSGSIHSIQNKSDQARAMIEIYLWDEPFTEFNTFVKVQDSHNQYIVQRVSGKDASISLANSIRKRSVKVTMDQAKAELNALKFSGKPLPPIYTINNTTLLDFEMAVRYLTRNFPQIFRADDGAFLFGARAPPTPHAFQARTAPLSLKVVFPPGKLLKDKDLDKKIKFHIDGLAVAPIFASLYQKGIFTLFTPRGTVTMEGILDYLESIGSHGNEGNLHHAFWQLEAQGWVKRVGYSASRKMEFRLTPEGFIAFKKMGYYSQITDLMPIASKMKDFLFAHTQPKISFRAFTELSRKKWGILDKEENKVLKKMVDHLDGVLLGSVFSTLKIHLKDNGIQVDKNEEPIEYEFKGDQSHLNQAFDLLVQNGFARKEGDTIVITPEGKYAFYMASRAEGITAAYLPTFAQIDESHFGDPNAMWVPDKDGNETHIHRHTNAVSSGESHETYYKEMEPEIIKLFNKPFKDQPRYVLDTGCGDGEFLEMVYRTVLTKTKRGELIRRNPSKYHLTMLGADLHNQSREAAIHRLENVEIEVDGKLFKIPFKVVEGNVNDPDQVMQTLSDLGIKEEKGILHLSSFLFHNRTYSFPKEVDPERVSSSKGTFSYRGLAIPNEFVEQDLVNFFKKWLPYLKRYGIFMRELHTLDPELIAENEGETFAPAFAGTHSYSDQFIVEQSVFLKCAREAGLVPKFIKSLRSDELPTISILYLQYDPDLAIQNPIKALIVGFMVSAGILVSAQVGAEPLGIIPSNWMDAGFIILVSAGVGLLAWFMLRKKPHQSSVPNSVVPQNRLGDSVAAIKSMVGTGLLDQALEETRSLDGELVEGTHLYEIIIEQLFEREEVDKAIKVAESITPEEGRKAEFYILLWRMIYEDERYFLKANEVANRIQEIINQLEDKPEVGSFLLSKALDTFAAQWIEIGHSSKAKFYAVQRDPQYIQTVYPLLYERAMNKGALADLAKYFRLLGLGVFLSVWEVFSRSALAQNTPKVSETPQIFPTVANLTEAMALIIPMVFGIVTIGLIIDRAFLTNKKISTKRAILESSALAVAVFTLWSGMHFLFLPRNITLNVATFISMDSIPWAMVTGVVWFIINVILIRNQDSEVQEKRKRLEEERLKKDEKFRQEAERLKREAEEYDKRKMEKEKEKEREREKEAARSSANSTTAGTPESSNTNVEAVAKPTKAHIQTAEVIEIPNENYFGVIEDSVKLFARWTETVSIESLRQNIQDQSFLNPLKRFYAAARVKSLRVQRGSHVEPLSTGALWNDIKKELLKHESLIGRGFTSVMIELQKYIMTIFVFALAFNFLLGLPALAAFELGQVHETSEIRDSALFARTNRALSLISGGSSKDGGVPSLVLFLGAVGGRLLQFEGVEEKFDRKEEEIKLFRKEARSLKYLTVTEASDPVYQKRLRYLQDIVERKLQDVRSSSDRYRGEEELDRLIEILGIAYGLREDRNDENKHEIDDKTSKDLEEILRALFKGKIDVEIMPMFLDSPQSLLTRRFDIHVQEEGRLEEMDASVIKGSLTKELVASWNHKFIEGYIFGVESRTLAEQRSKPIVELAPLPTVYDLTSFFNQDAIASQMVVRALRKVVAQGALEKGRVVFVSNHSSEEMEREISERLGDKLGRKLLEAAGPKNYIEIPAQDPLKLRTIHDHLGTEQFQLITDNASRWAMEMFSLVAIWELVGGDKVKRINGELRRILEQELKAQELLALHA